MNRKRIQELLIAGGFIALVAIAATERFAVRDVLAALLVFCMLVGALGIAIFALFLLGDGIERGFELLVACAASFRPRDPKILLASITQKIGRTSRHRAGP